MTIEKKINKAELIRRKRYSVHSKIMRLRGQLKLLEQQSEQLSKEIAKEDLYLCDSCGNWAEYDNMQMATRGEAIGAGKCISCCEEQYFLQLAKSVINQAGISLYDAPEELIELESIRAKTRHLLKQHK